VHEVPCVWVKIYMNVIVWICKLRGEENSNVKKKHKKSYWHNYVVGVVLVKFNSRPHNLNDR